MHILIPHALIENGPDAALELPHLLALLRGRTAEMQALPEDAADVARSLNLPGAGAGHWAFVTPAHWELGQARVALRDPRELNLHEDESRALLAAMQPWFAEDGLQLHYEQPLRWLVCEQTSQSSLLHGLLAPAPEQVLALDDRDVAPWLPTHPKLRRLQNEMQMLLYTHAVNDAREAHRQFPVNSFWLHAGGAQSTPALFGEPAEATVVLDALMPPALAADRTAWSRAWQAVDAQLAKLDAGSVKHIVLGGRTEAKCYARNASGLWSRLMQTLRPAKLSAILAA